MTIKVLIVDDSALVRQMMMAMLDSDPDIQVVGTAHDAYRAREKIKELDPDVITLDVEMPRMDGVTFLRNLMRLRPTPVIMVSTLTEKGADVTLQALEYGAIDFITKPKVELASSLVNYTDELISKVKTAAQAKVKKLDVETVPVKHAGLKHRLPNGKTTDRLIALGASTGGTEAIREVLETMPADSPGMVITQHIPEAFSLKFSKRMDSISAMTVSEAADGQPILPGHVYIAPGNRHLEVVRCGSQFQVHLDDGQAVNRHKPSVDVMFRSVAKNLGQNAISVLLTGMGCDGARGMLQMLEAGAQTIVQDEGSSVVWGMPGEAVRLGAAQHVVPLEQISDKIVSLLATR